MSSMLLLKMHIFIMTQTESVISKSKLVQTSGMRMIALFVIRDVLDMTDILTTYANGEVLTSVPPW